MANGKWGKTKSSSEKIILARNKLKPLRKSLHGSEGLKKARKRGQQTLNRLDRLLVHRREQTHSLKRLQSPEAKTRAKTEVKKGTGIKGGHRKNIQRAGKNLREINTELVKENKLLGNQSDIITAEKKKINAFLLKEQKQGRLKEKKLFRLL